MAFTTGQVARYCFVTADTIVNWIRSGSLRTQRTRGGQYRIRLADLLVFMREHGMSTDLVEDELDVRPHCWEFYCRGEAAEGCQSCIVYRSHALDCTALSAHVNRSCSQQRDCRDCEYRRRFPQAADQEA